MLDFDSAQDRLIAGVTLPDRREAVPLDVLAGRVLAADVLAQLDLPAADNSAMDGFALRAADAAMAGVALPVRQRCFAGQVPEPLQAGCAMRVFTGTILPPGADTVVRQEDCTAGDGQVVVNRLPRPGDHVRRRGEDMRRGQVVLPRGSLLAAMHIAVLAAQGMTEASVYPRVRVGILTSGDELLRPGQPLRPAALYDSNAPMLKSLCVGLGTAVPRVLHAADEVAAIGQALEDLSAVSDLVLSVGGVSVGERDLVRSTIEALGGTLDLWRVRMKPGKPVAVAELHGRPVVCLPGNPVAAFVAFTLLVSPVVRKLQGRRVLRPEVRRGVLRTDRVMGGDRDEFVRVRLDPQGPLPLLLPHDQQSPAAVGSLVGTDGLARIRAGMRAADGAELDWYALADWLR